VTVGPSGKAKEVDTGDADPNLAEEVRIFLKGATTFAEACTEQKVEVFFTFRLEGEPEWTPPVWVKFQPPNHFIIISRPKKPNLN